MIASRPPESESLSPHGNDLIRKKERAMIVPGSSNFTRRFGHELIAAQQVESNRSSDATTPAGEEAA
jgi:hypothetical protein